MRDTTPVRIDGFARMPDHFFISYSSVDGLPFSLKLADDLASGPPAFTVWLDKRHLRPSEDWDEQIAEAIRACKALIFVMTSDSVAATSVCKQEWTRALRYKKPIIPLLAAPDAEMPFRLEPRQRINFTSAYDSSLAQLRRHLTWMDSPEGQLQALKHRLADAQRDLPRAQPDQQPRIRDDIAELNRQISQQQTILDNPHAAEQRVQQTIERGLERARNLADPVAAAAHTKFINPPPLIAPTWFQDRHIETGLVGDFLKDEALRLMTVVGRGGIGKSALTCRLLRSLEAGQLPDDGGPLPIDGIVYLSDARSFHRINFPDLYASLIQLLPEETRRPLDSVYKNPQATTRQTMEALLAAFPRGRTVVLLDNFEDEMAIETGRIKNVELADALNALLELPPHALKVIVTTRVYPRDLASIEPGRQRRLNLDAGLDRPYAENILRAMDADGKVGLRDAEESLLTRARERTRGYPRALEHLFGILSADRDTSLREVLERTTQLLPDQVTTVLVGEAFSRLDLTAQRVMQALAIFRYPVPPAAVDCLLQPYIAGVDSSPVLSRLVNMQFVRRDAGRYFLHQIDRDYAESRLTEGAPADRAAEAPPFTRFALHHRAADWFKLARKPIENRKTLDDLAPQLAEFELRSLGQDWDTAARVLLAIDFDYLLLWGHYHLLTELHERLQGKVVDWSLAQNSALNLGTGYRTIGQFQRAIECYERALRLAREAKVREDEGASLSGLASCYAELGHNNRAVAYLEDALQIAREVKDRGGEATRLGNLGNRYSDQGEIVRAIESTRLALAIFREIKDRPGEALDLCNLGEMYTDLGQTEQAFECLHAARAIANEIGYRLAVANSCTNLGWLYLNQGDWANAANELRQAVEIADEIANLEFQHLARVGLAMSRLYQSDLSAAREMADAARRYNFPRSNHLSSVVLGIVALRQGDRQNARDAFASALNQAAELLSRTPQRYAALDSQGLALGGLSLCEDPSHSSAAKEAYAAARAITSAPGIVARVLRLFDALAQADSSGSLSQVRASAGRLDKSAIA